MTTNSFEKLIKELPVDYQSFPSKRTTWKKFENANQVVCDYNKQLFQQEESITVSRGNLFASTSDIVTFILKTIYWGYPRGMRGNNFTNINNEQKLYQLTTALKEIKIKSNISQAEFLRYFSAIPIGISTFSKLLYFLKIRLENLPCLILDNQLIKVFNKKIFEELDPLTDISYSRAQHFYHNYLQLLHSISHERYRADQLECFLYIFGNNLKGNTQD